MYSLCVCVIYTTFEFALNAHYAHTLSIAYLVATMPLATIFHFCLISRFFQIPLFHRMCAILVACVFFSSSSANIVCFWGEAKKKTVISSLVPNNIHKTIFKERLSNGKVLVSLLFCFVSFKNDSFCWNLYTQVWNYIRIIIFLQ